MLDMRFISRRLFEHLSTAPLQILPFRVRFRNDVPLTIAQELNWIVRKGGFSVMRRTFSGPLLFAVAIVSLPCKPYRSQAVFTKDKIIDREYGAGIIAQRGPLLGTGPTLTVVKNGLVRNTFEV